MSETELLYKAFISYRHKPLDKKAAEMVQKSIESFTIPPDMRDESGNKKFGKVFRDEDELPVSSSLSDSITYALDHSEFLIVICTPDLPASKWCEQEIRYFLSTHDRDHVIAVLADGDPETSFSPLLLREEGKDGEEGKDVEPLAANIAGPNHTIDRKAYQKEVVRIYASLLGCSFDALWQREKRARTNRLMAVTGAAFAAVSIFAGTVISKNRQISEQNRQLEKQMSSMYVDSGITALSSFREKEALDDALAAISGNDPEIYDHRAEKLLGDTLGAYMHGERKSTVVYEQETDILDMAVSRSGSFAIVSDQVGYIRRVDLESGQAVWEVPSGLDIESLSENISEVFLLRDEKTVIVKNSDFVTGLSTDTGETVWQYEYETENAFRCMSDDGKILAIADRNYFLPETWQTNPKLDIIFLDTASGEELSRITVGDDSHEIRVYSSDRWFGYGSGFSESGKLFACAFYEEALDEEKDDDVFHFYLIDREKQEVIKKGELHFTSSAKNIFYGIAVDEETESMRGLQYHSGYGGIVASIFNGKDETVTTEFTAQTLNDGSAGTLTLDVEMNILPMAASRNLAVIANGNLVTVFRLSDGKPSKGFEMAGEVVCLEWLDAEEEVLLVVTSAGDICLYDLEHEGDTFLNSYEVSESDQGDIAKAVRVGGGILRTKSYSKYIQGDSRESFFLTTSKQDTGKLLKMRLLTDPSEKKIEIPEGALYTYSKMMTSPSGEVLAGYFETMNDLVLSEYDRETHELIRSATFEKTYADSKEAVMFADDKMILRTKIYCLDGTVSFLERINDENRLTFDRYTQNTLTSDGHLLSVSYAYSQTEFPIPIWYDTKLVPESIEEETGITLVSGEVYTPTGNGYVTGRGILKGDDTKTEVFVSFHAGDNVKNAFADMYPESEGRIIATGSVKPLLACCYQEGVIVLYDLESGEGKELSVRFAPGEVRMLCFSEDDRYLLVMKNTGYIDLVDLEKEETALSLYSSYVKEHVRYIGSMDCMQDAENDRMYVMLRGSSYNYGTLFGVDTSAMTVFCRLDNSSYGWNRGNNYIYTYNFPDYKLYGYPAHKLQDLKEWAERMLSDETQEE